MGKIFTLLIFITALNLSAQSIIPQAINTHYNAISGDGEVGGLLELGEWSNLAYYADVRWKNHLKENLPYNEDMKPSYNNYYNEITAYNNVTQMQIFEFENDIYLQTGVHTSFLNNYEELIENSTNLQILNNFNYGKSLFTVILPPGWNRSKKLPVILGGQGYGADNNSMYGNKETNEAVLVAQSVLSGDGVIVIRSNSGGFGSVGINSNALNSVSSFLVDVMANYGADIHNIITNGASRAGNTALVWGLDPYNSGYTVKAIHSYVPPIKIGSQSRLSISTYPSNAVVYNRALDSEHGYSNHFFDMSAFPPVLMTKEDKAFITSRYLVGASDRNNYVEEANNKSIYGYFRKEELHESIRNKRIVIAQGTHDTFMPLAYFMEFDKQLTDNNINHRSIIGYAFGHDMVDASGDSKKTIDDLIKGEPIVPFENSERMFYMPSSIVNNNEKTVRRTPVKITDELIAGIRLKPGYESYFNTDWNSSKLAFSATIPVYGEVGSQLTLALVGETGKSWKVEMRREDGYKVAYSSEGVFGANCYGDDECGDEFIIKTIIANFEPNVMHDWTFYYDGKEIPNRFTPAVSPSQQYQKALSYFTINEPTKFEHPYLDTKMNMGVDQYHPLLLAENGNSAPVLENISRIVVTAGDPIQLNLNAVDADPDDSSDMLTYDLRLLSGDIIDMADSQFNRKTGELLYMTSPYMSSEVLQVEAFVKDGKGGVDSQIVTIEIVGN